MWIKNVTAQSLDDSNTREEGWSSGPEHGLICPEIPVTFASQHSKGWRHRNVYKPFDEKGTVLGDFKSTVQGRFLGIKEAGV